MAPLHRDKTKVYLEQTSTYFGSNTNTPAVITDGVVPAPKKPRKWLWVLLAVLCVAVCVFIGWYLGQGGGGKRQPTVTSTPTTIPVTPSDPPAPTIRANILNLKATDHTSTLGYVSLTWEAAGRSDVMYTIYRTEANANSYDMLATTSNTWYDDVTCLGGTGYVYRVIASVGGIEHASADAYVTTTHVPVSASSTPIPSHPTKLPDADSSIHDTLPKATPTPTTKASISHLIITDCSSSLGYISLSWEGAGRTDVSYAIYRRESSSGVFTLLSTTENTWYYDRSYTAGMYYNYKVTAFVHGTEHASMQQSITVATPPTPTPTARATISHLIITDYSSSLGYVSLNWDGAGRTDVSYDIYRRERSSDAFTLLATTENTWYYDRSYTAGTTCYYQVVAVVSGSEHSSVEAHVTIAPRTTATTRKTTPTPQREGVLSSIFSAQVGDYITFGRYEQDANHSNGKESIEWLVLDKQNNRLLVISRYGLDCQLYSQNYYQVKHFVTWETSTLRKWLNNDFIKAAFSSTEQTRIPTVTVSADTNPFYDSDPGNSTKDKIFLLSISESKRYFAHDKARGCQPTAYARQQGAAINNKGMCWWWLRTPGYSSTHVSFVGDTGGLFESGNIASDNDHAIRPAMWIALDP